MSRVASLRARADEAIDHDLVTRCSVNVMVTASEVDDRLTWAREIHEGSRRDGPFVAVFPATDRPVLAADVDDWFAQAARGTLFIDRVGLLSADAQARLGALLTSQLRRPYGATMRDGQDGPLLVTGSDRSLRTALAVGTFDDALFYRLNVIHIDQMPQDTQENPP